MERANRKQVADYLRRINAPAAIRRGALGNYGEEDRNTHNPPAYSENAVFYAPGGGEGGYQVKQPDIFFNRNSFALYPFSTSNVSGSNGSVQILNANDKRSLLLVQNQSAGSNLYVNFSSGAALNVGLLLSFGQGVIFDIVCPNNSISVYYDSATNQPGIIVEGAPQL